MPESHSDQPLLDDPASQPKQRRGSAFFEWVGIVLLAVVLAFLITRFVLQRNVVVGTSMMDTLISGDQLFVEKVSRHFGGLDYGDIITFKGEHLAHGVIADDDLVKRIIGKAGDQIEIRDGIVWRNGEPLDEPYLRDGTYTEDRDPQFSSVIVPEGEYYVLGDNRAVSKDSRSFGAIIEEDIIGEVWIRIYPFDRIGFP